MKSGSAFCLVDGLTGGALHRHPLVCVDRREHRGIFTTQANRRVGGHRHGCEDTGYPVGRDGRRESESPGIRSLGTAARGQGDSVLPAHSRTQQAVGPQREAPSQTQETSRPGQLSQARLPAQGGNRDSQAVCPHRSRDSELPSMIRNHRFSRAVADAGMSGFI